MSIGVIVAIPGPEILIHMLGLHFHIRGADPVRQRNGEKPVGSEQNATVRRLA